MRVLGRSRMDGERSFRCDMIGAMRRTRLSQLALAAALCASSTGTGSAQVPTGNPFPGAWSGAAQFQLTIAGKVDASAHSVADVELTLTPSGRMSGMATENGCRFLGVTTPGIAGVSLNVDVTLSGCRHPALNRRYFGQIVWSNPSRTAVLNVSSQASALGRQEHCDIKATLTK